MTLQDLFESQGFIVLAYTDPDDLKADLERGIVHGETVNGSIPDGSLLKITGPATEQEWKRQCDQTGDPYWVPELEPPQIAFLKVVAE